MGAGDVGSSEDPIEVATSKPEVDRTLKGNFGGVSGRCTTNMYKVLEVRVCCCACVYGESLLTSGERGIQEDNTKSFCFVTIQLDALLQQ